MNYAITGHRGLIGSYLDSFLQEQGNNRILGVDLKEGRDIRNPRDSFYPLAGSLDFVFHLAALCKIEESCSHREDYFKTNVFGTSQVLTLAKRGGAKKFVYFSSSRVLSPQNNPYVQTKVCAEALVRDFCKREGIDWLIIRPSTIYNPGLHGFVDETGRLLNHLIVRALNGSSVWINGDPATKTLDFTDVRDFCSGVRCAMSGPRNTTYAISGNQEETLLNVVKMISQNIGRPVTAEVYDANSIQPQQVRINNAPLMELGYQPKIPLSQTIKEGIKFWRAHPAESKKYFLLSEKDRPAQTKPKRNLIVRSD